MEHALQVEYRSPDDLTPYARNARTHSAEQVAQIAGSIREFGFTNPILTDEQGTIIAGHGRLAAAQKLGLEKVPCITIAGLTDTQRRALILADNRIAETAGWDAEMLRVELEELTEMGADLDLIGFDEESLDELIGGLDDEHTEGDTEPEEPPATPVTRRGDVWQLGKHRLMCGDSTSAEDVAKLMGGEKAEICFTSPPYAQQRDYTKAITDWDGLMNGALCNPPVTENAQVLVNLGLIHRDNEWQAYWQQWIGAMRDNGWRAFGWYVWDQGFGLPGEWNGRFAPSFEFVFHFNKTAKTPNKIMECSCSGETVHTHILRGKDNKKHATPHKGELINETKIPDSVVRILRVQGGNGTEHPAVFPVALAEHILQAYSDEGELAYEPFTGSGTAIIAAENTGRRAYGMELAPAYVDVSIKRWQQHTGQQATLDGKTFDEVAQERAQ